MRISLAFAVLVSLSAVLAPVASAQGTTAATFLKLGVGGRNVAMGGTGAAETSADALYWNPAGLNGLEGSALTFTHGSWLEDVGYQYLGYARWTPHGTMGLSITNLGAGSIDKVDKTGVATGTSYTPKDMAVAVTLAREAGKVPVGVTLKYVSSDIDGEKATAMAADLGAVISPLFLERKDVTVGLAIQNIGQKMKYVSEEESLPTNFKLGAAWAARPGLTLAADLNKAVETDLTVHLGAEYAYGLREGTELALRAGYATDRKGLGGLAGYTFGLGLGRKKFSLDYALAPFDDLGTAHRISAGFRF